MLKIIVESERLFLLYTSKRQLKNLTAVTAKIREGQQESGFPFLSPIEDATSRYHREVVIADSTVGNTKMSFSYFSWLIQGLLHWGTLL